MANIDFPSAPTVGQRYTFAGVVYTFTAQGVWSPGTSIVTQVVPQGRLTLQAGVPVMTSSTSGVTSIFYTPYFGNKVPLWDGSSMVMRTCGEVNGSTTDTTKNPSPLAANKLNDWFVWNDAGTPRLTHGPDWTDDVTRSAGTVLVRSELGVLLNSAAITNGPAIQRGTYIGTTMANAVGQLDWIYGAIAMPPVAGFFGVWNMYNRAQVTSWLGDLTQTWTYAGLTPRQVNNNTNAKFTYVTGQAEDTFDGTTYSAAYASGGSGVLLTGVGFDSNTAFSGVLGGNPSAATFGTSTGRFASATMGKHFMAWLEAVGNQTPSTQTIFGSGANPAFGNVSGSVSGFFFAGRF